MISNRYALENEGVITSDEIRQILEKYRIGKKPLAKLLGWGETTIIRYMEGDIPTNEYSTKLKCLLDNPEYYYELLIKRQDCLTNVAFKKSKKAVLTQITASRIYTVAYYIINKSDAEICASYIQYILYYVQVFSLALYDKEMFREEYSINNEHMPYLKVYQSMKRCGIYKLEIIDKFLEKDETELIDAVYEALSWHGPLALNKLANSEKAMLKISRDKCNNKIISKDSLKAYFKEICEKYRITTIDEIEKYISKRILELRELNM